MLVINIAIGAAPSSSGDCFTSNTYVTSASITYNSWITLANGYGLTITKNYYCHHSCIYNF